MSAYPPLRAQRRRDTKHRLTHDIDVWVASASADGAVSGAAVLRLGRRGAAGGHADGQPDRQEPGCHPNRSAGAWAHPRRVHDRGRRTAGDTMTKAKKTG